MLVQLGVDPRQNVDFVEIRTNLQDGRLKLRRSKFVLPSPGIREPNALFASFVLHLQRTDVGGLLSEVRTRTSRQPAAGGP